MDAERLAIYCADVGSIQKGNFGWAVVHGGEQRCGNSIGELVEGVAGSLAAGVKVALGFECPLWVPVSEDPLALTAGRKVDGDRPWSAGAGASVLATGLTETAWILGQVRRCLTKGGVPLPSVCLDWHEFVGSDALMLL